MPRQYTTPKLSADERLSIWAKESKCPYCGSQEIGCKDSEHKVEFYCNKCGANNPFSGPVVRRVIG